MVLDNLVEIEKLDKEKMLESIRLLGTQVKQIANEVKNIKVAASYKNVRQVVFLGMGGSALGAHCIKSVFGKNLKLPLSIINDYDLPGSVDDKTLIMAVSYSGNTEETISALEKARKKKAKLMIVSSNGDLTKLAKKYNFPALIFGTGNNPCGSPRMGLGYTIFGPLLMLQKAGLFKLPPKSIDSVHMALEKFENRFGANIPSNTNIAKTISAQILPHSVWFISSGHLSGSVHVAANQMNENAKRFGGYFLIPEINHHLMEGLRFPQEKNNFFIFCESDLFDARIRKRFALTKEVLTQNGIQYAVYNCEEKTPLLQAAELLVFGSYLSFYTAILEGINPTEIPFVDFFKAELKK